MATREYLKTNLERESSLTFGETGVGIFALTPDRQLAPSLSFGFDRTFQFDEYGSGISADDLLRNIENGHSFAVRQPRPSAGRLDADYPKGIDEQLSDGYWKYFVLDVTKPAFEAKMWKISGQIKVWGDDDLPAPEARGFLGSSWLPGLSKRDVLGAATRRCIHRCNPPKQCFEIGCTCNPELRSCV